MIVEAQRARTWRLRSGADAARISAARAAASDAGLLESGSSAEDGRLDDVLARVLLDLCTLMALTGMISFPVNGGAGPGAPGVGELKGAHRGGQQRQGRISSRPRASPPRSRRGSQHRHL